MLEILNRIDRTERQVPGAIVIAALISPGPVADFPYASQGRLGEADCKEMPITSA
jgi:hypothetical protein